jgi:hypothetical protein
MFTTLRLLSLSVLDSRPTFLCFLQSWEDAKLEYSKLLGKRPGAPRVLPTYQPMQLGRT